MSGTYKCDKCGLENGFHSNTCPIGQPGRISKLVAAALLVIGLLLITWLIWREATNGGWQLGLLVLFLFFPWVIAITMVGIYGILQNAATGNHRRAEWDAHGHPYKNPHHTIDGHYHTI